MAYQVYKTVDFGADKSGLLTVGYKLTMSGATRVTTGIQELVAGTGIYGAWIVVPDDVDGNDVRGVGLIWDTGEATPAFAVDEINLALLDLAQPIFDTKATTVGGSLAGGWSLGWGKVVKDVILKRLNIFGPGNTTTVPSQVFQLDEVVNPSYRNPM